MRAGLPQKEPEILARWAREDLYGALRESGKGRPKFVLHDGPPYANGNVHIGTALNKILKDMVVRSHQMAGKDSNYVPGWDCHGLPIEWKVEEEFYRSQGQDEARLLRFRRRSSPSAANAAPTPSTGSRVQREEFKRLGVVGDWDHPYTTMSYPAEAQIAREIFKFVANGLLYRGSKPVMWSVVEKTALAEAEIEYEDYVSDTIYVGVPGRGRRRFRRHLDDDAVDDSGQPRDRLLAPHRLRPLSRDATRRAGNWAKVGATYILAAVAGRRACFDAAQGRPRFEFLGRGLRRRARAAMVCAHPLHAHGYGFVVPLLDGDHVTEDAGTGFVHTAPGHGREDFELWTASTRAASGARHRDAHPLHGRRERRLHRRGAGLRGQARHHRQGREGRRQRGRDQGAGRSGRAHRARQAQAPVSA